MEILTNELIDNGNGGKYEDGYRLVYFNEDSYTIGAYCKTIEGFMIGLADCDPIIDESDIPPFISNDDLLNRCLGLLPSATSVAIYSTNGTCIQRKFRKKNNTKI